MTGSCIRFTNGKPEKNKFRRFKIKTLDEQNDYAALQEIVSRRYRDPNEIPDVILIDGGKGQIKCCLCCYWPKQMYKFGKKEELLFTPFSKDGIKLDIHSPVGKLLISLRDYAHHFAIKYHRLLRSKNGAGCLDFFI